MPRPGSLPLVVLLAVGVTAVSWGAVLTRLAAAPALAIAAYRVLWGTALFTPWAALGPAAELTRLSRREWGAVVVSGGALAAHFALWIASLERTSVASSVVLVDMTPLFVGVAAGWLFGTPPPRRFWIGLAIALAGCLVIFRAAVARGGGASSALGGNLLALGGALAMAVYLLAGASARQRLSLVAYVWPVYAVAAVVLVVVSALSGTPLGGFSRATHAYLLLLGLGPQCIGHTTYNWSLRWLPAAAVALVGLAEPVGASLLAYLVLGEPLTSSEVYGGGLILAGIYVAVRTGSRQGARLGARFR